MNINIRISGLVSCCKYLLFERRGERTEREFHRVPQKNQTLFKQTDTFWLLDIVNNFLQFLTGKSVRYSITPHPQYVCVSSQACRSLYEFHRVKHTLCLSFSLHRRAKAGTT